MDKSCYEMNAKMYYAQDCDLSYLNGKTIAVIGYGSQGHAHALNLRDSGCNVIIGLRKGKSWDKAEKDGFDVYTVAEAAKKADIIMMLVNDERAADIYNESIGPQPGGRQCPGLCPRLQHPLQADRSSRRCGCVHGCPQGPRPHRPRPVCDRARACPAWSPWSRMPPATAKNIALAYIAGIGGARAGIMETTMDIETETDLFGEQTVLCGGVIDLMQCGFETLCEAGYAPENAYFECIHEMKLIVDLINKGGVAAMNYSISDTAEYGEYVSGPRVIHHEQTKASMRAVLCDIQDGTFAGRWIAENKNGRTFFNSKRAAAGQAPHGDRGRVPAREHAVEEQRHR